MILRSLFTLLQETRNPVLYRIDRIGRGIIKITYFIFQIAGAITFIGKQFSARKPARPTEFVIQPDVHSLRPRLFQTDPDIAEPVFRKIFRFQTCTRMKDKSAQSERLHFFDLTAELIFIERGVDAPEYHGTIIIDLRTRNALKDVFL